MQFTSLKRERGNHFATLLLVFSATFSCFSRSLLDQLSHKIHVKCIVSIKIHIKCIVSVLQEDCEA